MHLISHETGRGQVTVSNNEREEGRVSGVDSDEMNEGDGEVSGNVGD